MLSLLAMPLLIYFVSLMGNKTGRGKPLFSLRPKKYEFKIETEEVFDYAPQEELSVKELVQARYEGIRPAIGYPSLPAQRTIFRVARLLDVGKIGISLTENGAMYPQSSVCGIYIANKNARYFVI